MKFDPSAIDSPLALIALFVAIIELFLIFPITKLNGRDRSLLVSFVIGYPVFIAGAFFIFLWNKPVNLYKPQTLSEHLQEALLPERLNGQLAPDRAAVAVIELKITTLEKQFADISQRMQSSPAGVSAPNDIAKLSDLDKLKAELLARAQASGDISRVGLATAARAIQTQQTKSQDDRIALAKERSEQFKSWAKTKGLKVLLAPPNISANNGSLAGPTVGSSTITLGPPERDYIIPGLYVNRVSASRGFDTDVLNSTLEVEWTAADYMACRFAEIGFPNPEAGPLEKRGASDIDRLYDATYDLFNELIVKFGNAPVEAGVIAMMNEWNSKSNLDSSLESFAQGISAKGAEPKSVQAIFAKFRARVTVKEADTK